MHSHRTPRPKMLTMVLGAGLLTLVLLAALLVRPALSGMSQTEAAPEVRIAFEHYVQSDPDPPQIAIVNTDGTNLSPVITEGRTFDPAWSPDGTKLAYFLGGPDNQGYGDIYVSDADGSNPTRLTTDGRNLDPTWSPDGLKIAFVNDTETESAQIHVMEADGANRTPLTTPGDRGSSLEPAWSPDGTQIAFSSSTPGNITFDIYVMGADGANPTRLTTLEGRDGAPAWSPDGTRIAFTDLPIDSMYTVVYVMDADGANVTRLTPSDDSSHYMDPAWSPDGSTIAVASDREDNALRVFLMDADESNLRRLGSEYGAGPAWAPDAAAGAAP